jgi:hypothetical protein
MLQRTNVDASQAACHPFFFYLGFFFPLGSLIAALEWALGDIGFNNQSPLCWVQSSEQALTASIHPTSNRSATRQQLIVA